MLVMTVIKHGLYPCSQDKPDNSAINSSLVILHVRSDRTTGEILFIYSKFQRNGETRNILLVIIAIPNDLC